MSARRARPGWPSHRLPTPGDSARWPASPRSGGCAADRVAVERCLFRGEPGGVAVEIEVLLLTEIDANGRLATSLTFDLDDRRAAVAEAEARFAAGEAAAVGGQAPFTAFGRAFAERDWEALRGCLAHHAVVHDHRALVGAGELRRDGFIETRRALADLAPDAAVEPLRILVWNPHGRVSVWRGSGTVRDGGPFEAVFVGVYLTDRDRILRYECFDVDDVDRALARFEELCAGLESAPRSA